MYAQKLNLKTKKAQRFVWMYNRSRIYNVRMAYNNPSCYKLIAEERILKEMTDIGGYGYRVTGANCMKFSCAYRYDDEMHEYLIYHTAEHTYQIQLS